LMVLDPMSIPHVSIALPPMKVPADSTPGSSGDPEIMYTQFDMSKRA